MNVLWRMITVMSTLYALIQKEDTDALAKTATKVTVSLAMILLNVQMGHIIVQSKPNALN